MIKYTWEFAAGKKCCSSLQRSWKYHCISSRSYTLNIHLLTEESIRCSLGQVTCVYAILTKRKTNIKRTLYFRANIWRHSKSVSSYSVILLGFSLFQNSTRSHFTLWYILKTATMASSCQFRSFPRRSLCRMLANALRELWRDFLMFSQLFFIPSCIIITKENVRCFLFFFISLWLLVSSSSKPPVVCEMYAVFNWQLTSEIASNEVKWIEIKRNLSKKNQNVLLFYFIICFSPATTDVPSERFYLWEELD